jgi:hypothetical protein
MFSLCSQVIFATISNRKDNFIVYIALGEFQVLAHFHDFGARNGLSE